MKLYYRNKFVGALCLIVGLVGFLLAVGDLVMRLLVAICCIGIINYGLQLYGINSIQRVVNQVIMRRWFM